MSNKPNPQQAAAKAARIVAQADAFAKVLNCDPEEVMYDKYGVALTPDQADVLLTILRGRES